MAEYETCQAPHLRVKNRVFQWTGNKADLPDWIREDRSWLDTEGKYKHYHEYTKGGVNLVVDGCMCVHIVKPGDYLAQGELVPPGNYRKRLVYWPRADFEKKWRLAKTALFDKIRIPLEGSTK